MNLIISNQENFQTNSSIHNLIPGINIILVDQMPTYLVFRESTFYAGIKIFISLPHSP